MGPLMNRLNEMLMSKLMGVFIYTLIYIIMDGSMLNCL